MSYVMYHVLFVTDHAFLDFATSFREPVRILYTPRMHQETKKHSVIFLNIENMAARGHPLHRAERRVTLLPNSESPHHHLLYPPNGNLASTLRCEQSNCKLVIITISGAGKTSIRLITNLNGLINQLESVAYKITSRFSTGYESYDRDGLYQEDRRPKTLPASQELEAGCLRRTSNLGVDCMITALLFIGSILPRCGRRAVDVGRQPARRVK
ncbi:hypothetical protein BD410DRAFT_399409 [Rickenella mellea]|uniref:Uncharacterized protein n=1 Tax=Rickenella mellea TaxID=50990 RepID=A0A4Y7PE66_9AGAM|nr:hypothetical protein BD410DRAFT_399409 [Rickenella mellea]